MIKFFEEFVKQNYQLSLFIQIGKKNGIEEVLNLYIRCSYNNGIVICSDIISKKLNILAFLFINYIKI